MNSASDNQISDNEAGSSGRSAFGSTEELIGFAQDYYSNDFPNPDRQDCDSNALKATVYSGASPDDKLRTHLFDCSECFREYQIALSTYRAERREVAASPSESWWTRWSAPFSLRPLPIFAGALSLLLLAFIGAYVWQQYRSVPDRIVAKPDSAPIVASADNSSRNNLASATPETSPSIGKPIEQTQPERPPKPNNQQTEPSPRPSNQGELLAMSTVQIDLENYAITRGGAGRGGEIKLTGPRTRLIVALPEGSVTGLYTVSIVDSSGNSLVASRARSTDGKTLTATLNMQKLAPQKYTLRVSRGSETPVNVPIIISAGRTVPPP